MINKIRLIIISTLFCTNILAQEYNAVTIDEKTEKSILIGYTTLEAFKDTNFSWWWNSAYNMYEIDSVATGELKANISDVKIKIVMGTWCEDSRREVPHLYKILNTIDYPVDKVILINVNRDMQGIANEVEELEIKFVPTIIFSRAGNELGRIIEMPYETLEQDMLEIILGHSENEN